MFSMSLSLASVLFAPFHALLAHHITTPMELAVALLHLSNLMRIKTPPTTQQITSLHSPRPVPVALPAEGTQRPLAQILVTIVGRVMNVDQFQSLRGLRVLLWSCSRLWSPPSVHQPQFILSLLLWGWRCCCSTLRCHIHQTSLIVLSHERITNHPEWRQRTPTSLHRTRSRDPMAFAVGP